MKWECIDVGYTAQYYNFHDARAEQLRFILKMFFNFFFSTLFIVQECIDVVYTALYYNFHEARVEQMRFILKILIE